MTVVTACERLFKHRYMQSTTQSAVHRPSGTRVCNLQSSHDELPCLFVRGGAPLSRERVADSAVVVVRVARHDVHEVVRPHLDVERREMSDAISDGHMLRRASERRGVLAGVRGTAPAGGAAPPRRRLLDVRSHPAGAAAVRLGEHLPHLILLDLLANLRGGKGRAKWVEGDQATAGAVHSCATLRPPSLGRAWLACEAIRLRSSRSTLPFWPWSKRRNALWMSSVPGRSIILLSTTWRAQARGWGHDQGQG